MNKKAFILILLFVFVFSFPYFAKASNQSSSQAKNFCVVYFTGIGCPHCAKTDPVILNSLLKRHDNLVVIEYEIYRQRENAGLLYEYGKKNNLSLGIPFILFGDGKYLLGDRDILTGIEPSVSKKLSSPCLLVDGSSKSFKDLDINALPGFPKIWTKDKILIKKGDKATGQPIKELIESSNIVQSLNSFSYKKIAPEKVYLSGKSLNFDNAVQIDNWIFQWNGKPVLPKTDLNEGKNNLSPSQKNLISEEEGKLTFAKVIFLASVDAVNPCALAVLALVLLAIFSYDPKKKNVLLAGFAFIVSIFIIYFLYGLAIIKFFQFIQTFTVARVWSYKILGILAIILGVLNIKDFISYKPGTLGTEMPLSLRPKVKKIISGITSPIGAFIIGIFVTLFLLPCTIGPYVIAGGILSNLQILKAIPWLLLYNLIFILPMAVVVILVYFGFKKVEDVSGWKEKNIRYLHFWAGIIMVVLGLIMFFGIL